MDQLHNQIFTPFLEKNPQRVNYEKRKMQETPYFLDAHRRQVVLETLIKEKFSDDARTRFWSDHGSTRYLFSEHELYHTMRYVIEEQGEKMAYFLNPNVTGILT